MKKLLVIIYALLFCAFCVEMAHDFVETAEITSMYKIDKGEQKAEEKKDKDEYKIACAGSTTTTRLVPQSVYGCTSQCNTPQPGFFEIPLPPPNSSC